MTTHRGGVLWLGVIGALAAWSPAAGTQRDRPPEEIPVICTVDYRDPLPPEWLGKAGIRAVYAYVGLPVRRDPAAGRAVLQDKPKAELEAFLKRYGEAGVKVLLVTNFYTRGPRAADAVDAGGRKIRMACLNREAFGAWMRRAIREMAEAFGQYKGFGGFLFDDGIHVRVDCCHCPTCRRLFKEACGADPPPFEPYAGPDRLEPNDPVLLWDAFHRRAYDRYMRTQAEAARAAGKGLTLLTIPSDSWFYGRHMSRRLARAETSTGADAHLQRIERMQVKRWHIFQSFPCPRVVATGRGLVPYAVGCHLITPSPGIILHHEGPVIDHRGHRHFLGPAEIGRLMRTTIAEGAGGVCFWEDARAIHDYGEAFDAIGAAGADLRKARPVLRERKAFPARVALVYSTTTEIVQQPWRTNTLERWRHLHAFEAMAYALTRRSVQFRILFEEELTDKALAGLDAAILTGVTHLRRPVAERLERAAAAGKLAVLTDPTCLALRGAAVCRFDPLFWYAKQLGGYRQISHLDTQAARIAEKVVRKLDLPALQPMSLAGRSCFVKLFAGRDDSLLAFVVNWQTQRASTAVLESSAAWRLADAVTGKAVGRISARKEAKLDVPPAGWRVLRCRRAK